jgi:hypothetical protein
VLLDEAGKLMAHTCFEEGYPRSRGADGYRFPARVRHSVDSSKSGANTRPRANWPIASMRTTTQMSFRSGFVGS